MADAWLSLRERARQLMSYCLVQGAPQAQDEFLSVLGKVVHFQFSNEARAGCPSPDEIENLMAVTQQCANESFKFHDKRILEFAQEAEELGKLCMRSRAYKISCS